MKKIIITFLLLVMAGSMYKYRNKLQVDACITGYLSGVKTEPPYFEYQKRYAEFICKKIYTLSINDYVMLKL